MLVHDSVEKYEYHLSLFIKAKGGPSILQSNSSRPHTPKFQEMRSNVQKHSKDPYDIVYSTA